MTKYAGVPATAISEHEAGDKQRQTGMAALATLFVVTVFIFANMYTTQAILPVLSRELHISAPTAGLTVSTLVLAVAIGSLFYGPLSDRIGRKPVMVGTSLLLAVPTLLCGLAPNFAVLVILRTMQGLLIPGLTSVAIAYVNETFSGRRRGLAMGIYVCGTTVGGLFARTGSALLTGAFTWRIALLAFALPTLLAALAIWLFLPEMGVQHSPGPRKEALPPHQEPLKGIQQAHVKAASPFSMYGAFLFQAFSDMGEHLRNRRLVGAFVIGFTLFFGFIGTFTYLPYYLTGPHFKLSTEAVGLVYVLWLTGVFSPFAGIIAQRVGSRRTIAFSMTLAALGLLITLAPLLPIVIIGLGLVTLGMFSTVPAVNLYLDEQATRAKGTAASMYLSSYYLGGSIGAILPGLALLWFGWPGVVLFCLTLIIVALLSDAVLCR
ncbi:MAG TPA: MFS transporter [Ktedonosporobacter sp.]|nr:MFS transporter [Ktedonosporobacter sp.]